MILVIMGAGASYDAIPSIPPLVPNNNRLPLANDLFENQYLPRGPLKKYEKCLPIIPYLQHTKDGFSIEDELQKLQDEATHNRERLKQLAAVRFYLHNLFLVMDHAWFNQGHRVTNHLTMIDQIKNILPDEKICFVTFNYDRLIEFNLGHHGVNFRTIDEYTSNEQFLLIKLHGSANWARQVISFTNVGGKGGRFEEVINGENLEFSKTFEILDRDLTADVSGKWLYPAIAIPVQSKLEFECPEAHIKKLKEILRSIKYIIMIGWRGAESHFVKLLLENQVREVPTLIISASKETARQVSETLIASGLRAQYHYAEAGFTDSIKDRLIENFLYREQAS